MHDKMAYKPTGNDIFDAGARGENFVVLALANETSKVAVKTPWGTLTERKELHNLEMQGTVSAPIRCSVQIGEIGDFCLRAGLGYMYRGCLSLPPLSYINDILSVTDCNYKSAKVNCNYRSKNQSKTIGIWRN